MLDSPKKVALAQSLYENRDNTIDEICKTLNVSRATLYPTFKGCLQPFDISVQFVGLEGDVPEQHLGKSNACEATP